MTDRVYPSSKPQAVNGTTTTANPAFPATKAQLYGATRPVYRPQPHPRRQRRSCCCSLCLWLTLLIILLLLLAAIAGAVIYVLYRPHRPDFSVTALRISQFNLTSSSQLNAKLNLTIAARNPNKKLVFYYDAMSVSVSSNGVDVSDGTVPAFVHGTKNTTALRVLTTSAAAQQLDTTSASTLKSDMKKGLPLKVRVDTKVKVKIGGLKTTKLRIRVSCDGIEATVPTGKSPTTASTSGSKCKVDLRIKIWKWTF
ncbi:hypothetical protein L1049_004253 [Liquidambar formosana]|uniref:Late embryogenesis abundant protein LEA-2 subgroup domain-containing protein n=1 Tax=Liquidambar formosana TaxID=63359 RepID=A0AAP0RP66_LIQFO